MSITAIGVTSQSGAAAKQVAFDLISARHYQLVKLGFGDEGASTLVSSTNPMPVADKGTARTTMPALVSDGDAASALRDVSGRIITADGLFGDKLLANGTTAAGTTELFAAQGSGLVSWVRHVYLKNLGRQFRVTCTIGGSYQFILDPGEESAITIPAKFLASSSNAALNLVVSPSTAKVLFNVGGYKDRA